MIPIKKEFFNAHNAAVAAAMKAAYHGPLSEEAEAGGWQMRLYRYVYNAHLISSLASLGNQPIGYSLDELVNYQYLVYSDPTSGRAIAKKRLDEYLDRLIACGRNGQSAGGVPMELVNEWRWMGQRAAQ